MDRDAAAKLSYVTNWQFIDAVTAGTADWNLSGAADVSQAPMLRRERLDEIVSAGVARADNLTRDHPVTVNLPESLPPVSVDAASIIEVVYMLLDNASKYAPAGSTKATGSDCV